MQMKLQLVKQTLKKIHDTCWMIYVKCNDYIKYCIFLSIKVNVTHLLIPNAEHCSIKYCPTYLQVIE